MINVTFRPVVLRLTSLLANMHAACFGPECWSLDQMHGSLSLETTRGFIGEIDQNPVGFILYQLTGFESEILTICVLPPFRRITAGKKMLNHMLSSLPNNIPVHLEVAADNYAARRLYESCGFTESAIRHKYYKRPVGFVDAICYKRDGVKAE